MAEQEGKKRILFVDDEAKVLDGIRRLLWDMEEEWDMDFALSGSEALQLMKKHAADVLVSDMRMPEMDGVELLTIIKNKYPHTVRFILSGYTDKEMILKTVGPTDQFLSKPCDPDVLKASIKTALESHKIIDKKRVRKMVSELRSLPTLPDLYLKVKRAIESPDTSFKDIAGVVSKDVAITAKVMQLVNSAFFGLRQRIENLQLALTYLGIETLKAVILTSDVFSKFTPQEIETFKIRNIYRHSIFVSLLSRKLVQVVKKDPRLMDEASMGGMLHDIGKLVFIKNKPKEYQEAYERRRKMKVPLYVVEKEIFKVTHADVGGYLMNKWGLPQNIVHAISYHHNPLLSLNPSFDSLSVVYLANALEHEEIRDETYEEDRALRKGYLTKLELMKYLPQWREMTRYAKKLQENEREIFQ